MLRQLISWPILTAVTVACLFLIGLEISMWAPGFVGWYGVFFLVAFLVASIYLSWEIHFEIRRMSLLWLGLPAFLAIILLLPRDAWLQIYFVVLSVVFGWFVYTGSRLSFTWSHHAVLFFLTFLNAGLLLAWRTYLGPPLEVFLPILFGVLTILTWQFLSIFAQRDTLLLVSVTLGFILSQVGWILYFLPLSYIVQAAVMAIVYYVCVYLVGIAWQGQLTRRIMVEYIGVGVGTLSFILLVTSWI